MGVYMSKLKYSMYLNNASKTFGERGFETILAIVLSLGSLALLFLFPVAGIALMAFSYGFLCVGTKSFLLGVARGEFLPIETVFSKFRICVKAFCLKVATMLITFLWSIVFIIPGIVTALNYSMATFVMADENLSSLECMVKSKKLVHGHRGEILVLNLSYFFVILVVMCICAGLGSAMKFFLNVNYWIPIVSMVTLALFFIIVFIVPYYELMFAHIYLLLKDEKREEQKEDKKEEKKTTSQTKRKYTKKQTEVNSLSN